MTRGARAIINLAALQHNLQMVKARWPKQKVLAVLKANAYGHDANLIAHALQDKVEAIGLACLSEAVQLRQANIKTRLVLLEGFLHTDELPEIIKHDLDIVIHNQEQLNALINFHEVKDYKFRVWLKFNLGMNRLGFNKEAGKQAYAQLKLAEHVHDDIVLVGHFSQAEDNLVRAQQRARFINYTAGLKAEHCLGNSAACLLDEQLQQFEWLRPGLLLYGVSPVPGQTATQLGLQAVMNLTAKLIAIQSLEAGQTLGYGDSWQAEQTTRVGIVALGYADGFPWRAQTGTPVLVNGQLSQVLGRPSMDMLHVDLSNVAANIGDPVMLWGDGLPVEALAERVGTIPYELLTHVGQRVSYEVSPKNSYPARGYPMHKSMYKNSLPLAGEGISET